MIDFIVIPKENGTKETRYRGSCGQCKADKGYVRKDRIHNLCKKCTIELKKGRIPHNKGKTLTQETKCKISIGSRGRIPWNKGSKFSQTSKTQQGRDRSEVINARLQCFQRDDYTCDKCCKRGVKLNAHHLNSWRNFPEQRFNISNLITLCNYCHKLFHSIYGNSRIAPNTKEQYLEFKLAL